MNALGVAFSIQGAQESVEREWFTCAELAELQLPGLPGDKRSLNRRAREEGWTLRVDADGELLSRPRAGRGGGTEFHISLLPPAARLQLANLGLGAGALVSEERDLPSAGSWQWYEAQTAKVKAEAERRAAIVAEFDLLKTSGMTGTAAANACAQRHSMAASTVWGWLKLVEGVAPSDRLPALAPRRKGGGKETEIHPYLWDTYRSDVLRMSGASLTSCYERTAAIAREKGLSMPSERTMRRRLERDHHPAIILYLRKGPKAFERSLPDQRRSVEGLRALELVNIDGHKFDVFVRTADGRVIRPIMVAIQDVYSRKIVAWRIGEAESAVLTRLAFADLFANFGIPRACLLDNGRAFASKWITGGAKTRFRFKIKEEEPTGLLTSLGIQIHWAKPYHGQAKPIERGFRDLCDTIARHPAMEGAYTGSNPMAKPENYDSRAIAWDEFCAHVARGIAAHNAKLGRRAAVCRGRSFDQTFAESYATSPVGKATPEQLRMALLAADSIAVDRRTGIVELYGNRYWSEGCMQLHGEKVTVRFDPDNLKSEIHLYGLDGRYLTSARVIDDTGFLDVAEAKRWAKRKADLRKMVRDGIAAEELLPAEEVARRQADAPPPELPEARVIRAIRPIGNTAALRKVEHEPDTGRATIDRMSKAVLKLVQDSE